MTFEEMDRLRTAILTISDPRGNWELGWRAICELAEIDALKFPAPFRLRTDEELRRGGPKASP